MKTILLLEDCLALQEFLQEMLEKDGYNVLAFENPASATKHLTLNAGVEIHGIVSDWDMPRMNGIDFLTRLRHGSYVSGGIINPKSPLAKDTPFVICTAPDEPKREAEKVQQAQNAGVGFYQSKDLSHDFQLMLDYLKGAIL